MTRSALLRQIRILPPSLLSSDPRAAPENVAALRLSLLRAAQSAPTAVVDDIRSLRDVCSFVSTHGCVYNTITKEESACPAP